VIKKAGAFYSYWETRLGQGRENAKTFLKENADMAAEIEEVIKNSI
jgi:recombination protein RecA